MRSNARPLMECARKVSASVTAATGGGVLDFVSRAGAGSEAPPPPLISAVYAALTCCMQDVAHACDTVTLIDGGRIVDRSTPERLAALGADADLPGDSAIERGYTATLRVHR